MSTLSPRLVAPRILVPRIPRIWRLSFRPLARLFLLTGLVSLSVSSLGLAAVEKTSEATKPILQDLKYVLCKNNKVVRTIRMSQPSNDKTQCLITYTKAGVDRVVGGGTSPSGCQVILDNIRINLEKSHWQCRDVSGKISAGNSYYTPSSANQESKAGGGE